MKKFRKVLSVLVAAAMTAALTVPVFAEKQVHLGEEYAVFLNGADETEDDPAFELSGNARVLGNLVLANGDYQVDIAWERAVTGTIYPSGNSELIAQGDWAKSEIERLYDIAETGDYTVTLPNTPNINFPELEQKGQLSVHNQDVTVSENGWYSSIEIGGNPNTLTFDVPDGKVLHIRTDYLSLNGNIVINGTGKVYLYVDEFKGTNGQINAKSKDSFGDSQQLSIIFENETEIKSGLTVAADLFASNELEVKAASISGNIYAADDLDIGANAWISGLVYAPYADIEMEGSSSIIGKLIADTLEMKGSATIENADVTGFNPDIPEPAEPAATEAPAVTPAPEATAEPEMTPAPENTPVPTEKPVISPPPVSMNGGFVNGLLGEYFDREDLTKQTTRLQRIDQNVAFNWHLNPPDDAIEPETFSVRWSGYISPAVSGTYQFKTYSDDGVRLSIGDQVLIDRWGLVNLEYTVAEESVYLEAGKFYQFNLDYQQIPINATIFLFWESDAVQSEIVPASVFYVTQEYYDFYSTPQYPNPVKKEGTGLLNQFSTESVDGPYQAVEIKDINYEWGEGAPEGIDTDVFYGKMTGYIEGKYTEPVKLSFVIDDAIRVWIDGQLIIDAWDYHSNDYVEGTFNAIAGKMHKIEIEYADMGIGATCIMRWEDLGGHAEVVPIEFLYPDND